MLKSMTGFARIEQQGEYGSLVWELRSVNHRYLEVNFRMPEEFRALEMKLREQVAKYCKRGKIDANLRWTQRPQHNDDLPLNTGLAGQLIQAAEALQQQSANPAPLDMLQVLNWPGVVREPQLDIKPMQQAGRQAFIEGLKALTEVRGTEGGRIAEMLTERLDKVETHAQLVSKNLPQVQAEIRARYQARLDELEVEPDSNRLEAEMAIIAQKMDVAEELDRLQAHVQETRQVIQRKEPVGRRLDFLMQEFNREANTLGSKSQDVSTTKAAVELKVLIEQMREQVQNIE